MVMRPQGGALRRADRTTGARRLAPRAGRFAAVVAAAALLAGCAAGPDSPFAVFQPRVPDLPKVDPAAYPNLSTPDVARKPTLTPEAQAKLQKDLERVSKDQGNSVLQSIEKGP